MNNKGIKFIGLLMILFIMIHANAKTLVRLKDLVDIEGVRGNQLFGYGLVVGLNGTGDKTQTVFTAQSLTNMLDKMGVVPSKISKFGLSTSGSEMKVKNVAAVLVTAKLSAFVRKGALIDVTVSSIGDCKSLEGGTLILTPLQAANGEVYAVAQGALTIGGKEASATIPNHPTVAKIPSGAYVEQDVLTEFIHDQKILLSLKEPDFTTANRIAQEINKDNPNLSNAVDAGQIEIRVNDLVKNNPIKFLSWLEQLTVVDDLKAKVVINERTGTIVTGENVKISSVAVSHGTLTVSISPERDENGNPVDTGAMLDSKIILVENSIDIGAVARSLSALGATPTDMIAIFQALRKTGALKAQLEIM